MTTSSWTLTTYTNDGYMIDQKSTGLTLSFTCNSPCLTCLANNPNMCLTCNTFSGAPILYNGGCYQTCPDSTYYSTAVGSCVFCDPICRTCIYYDGKICTSCNSDSEYPYLNGNICSNKCAFG